MSLTFAIKKAFGITSVLLFFTIILICSEINAEIRGKTVIKSVKISGTEVNRENWDNNIEITPGKSIAFVYDAEGIGVDQAALTYKIFLDGKIHASRQGGENNNEISFSGLTAGKAYVVRIQAFADNDAVEGTPVAVSFKVISNPESAKGNESSSNMIFYAAIALFLILIVLILALWLRKRTGRTGQQEKMSTPAGGIRQTNPAAAMKTTAARSFPEGDKQMTDEDLVTEYNRLNSEHADLEYSYKRLKKECEALKETNEFLNQQIQMLKSNVTDLEKANSQLAQQKEKLLDSKRQLEELQAQKDELFAIAIHDIKNPAAAIRGYVELLESYDLNAQEQQEVMQSLADTSSHIISLAHQMTLAVIKQKPEPGLKMEVGSLKEIADSVCLRNMGYAINKKVKLINQTSSNTPETAMDVTKIEEVLDNLVNNAIKYAPEGTVVQVRSYFSGTRITVEVIDNGVGLSPEDCKKAFAKGALLTPDSTAGEPRSGLGLWIVKKVIEEHDGIVWLKSKQGVGSTFAFELPIKR